MDAALPDLGAPTKEQLEDAVHGHVLGEAVLMGTHQRWRTGRY